MALGGVKAADLYALLKLDDQATGELKKFRGAAVATLGAVSASMLAAGAKWDQAQKTIVQGTGATGDALDGLMDQYRQLSGRVTGDVASAVADMNTHLGLSGDTLGRVAEVAAATGANTNKLGAVMRKMGLDADGATQFMDDMVATNQATGVSVDGLTDSINRQAPKMLELGLSMDEVVAHAVRLAHETGSKEGLPGAWQELRRSIKDGAEPALVSVREQLGETAGKALESEEASRTFAESMGLVKDRVAAALGPMGNIVGSIAGAGAAAVTAVPGMIAAAKAIKGMGRAAKLAMIGTGIGALIVGLGALGVAIVENKEKLIGWRDRLNDWRDSVRRANGAMSDAEAAAYDMALAEEAAARETEAYNETQAKIIKILADRKREEEEAAAAAKKAAEEAAAAYAKMVDDTKKKLGELSEALGDKGLAGTGKEVRREVDAMDDAFAGVRATMDDFEVPLFKTITRLTEIKDEAPKVASSWTGMWLNFKIQVKEAWGGLKEMFSTGGLAALASGGAIALLSAFGPKLISGIKKIASKAWGWLKSKLFGKDKHAEAAKAAAEAARDAWLDTIDTLVGAWDRATEAGRKSYDETYRAAIKSGASVAEAANLAANAQIAATAVVMDAEKRKFIFIETRERLLQAIREGYSGDLQALARKTAEETSRAFDAAWTTVRDVTEATTNEMQVRYAHIRQTNEDVTKNISDQFEKVVKPSIIEGGVEPLMGVKAVMDSIETEKLITITTRHVTVGEPHGSRTAGSGGGGGPVGSTGVFGDYGIAANRALELTAGLMGRIPKGLDSAGWTKLVSPMLGENGWAELAYLTEWARTNNFIGFRRGTGGIRDFGTGTPAVLHGQEAVMTKRDIMDLIAAAAKGGGGSGPTQIVVDKRVLGEVVMDSIEKTAARRGIRSIRTV